MNPLSISPQPRFSYSLKSIHCCHIPLIQFENALFSYVFLVLYCRQFGVAMCRWRIPKAFCFFPFTLLPISSNCIVSVITSTWITYKTWFPCPIGLYIQLLMYIANYRYLVTEIFSWQTVFIISPNNLLLLNFLLSCIPPLSYCLILPNLLWLCLSFIHNKYKNCQI